MDMDHHEMEEKVLEFLDNFGLSHLKNNLKGRKKIEKKTSIKLLRKT